MVLDRITVQGSNQPGRAQIAGNESTIDPEEQMVERETRWRGLQSKIL